MIDVPVEVKDALREGTYKKNYRFVVLNDDGTEDFTIDNDTLVSESVNIDERMCSGDTLKFGLCEGSSLEFQYFNKPNITGKRVQAFVDVQYEKVITEYVWETQASFNNYYTISGMSGECRLYSSLSNAWNYVYVRENGVATQVYPTPSASGTIIELGDVTGRTFFVSLDIMPAPSAQLQLLIPHTRSQILTYSIPMGFFDVKKCSRQASTGIIKVTAYNKLQSDYLDAKANDLLIETYENIDPAFIPDITFDDILKIALGNYSINESTLPVTQKAWGVSRFRNGVWYDAGHLTLTTVKEFKTFYKTRSQGQITYFDSFIDGGIQIVAKGLQPLIDYVQENNLPTTDVDSGYSYLCISIAYGSPIFASTPVYYRCEIDNDTITLPYMRNAFVGSSTTAPSPGVTAPIEISVFCPIAEEPVSSDVVDAKMQELMANATVEILYTPPSSIGETTVSSIINDLPDVTLRDLQSAVYECDCQFGQLDRVTDLFSGVDLNYGGLYPADTLYPANDLYPGGAVMSANKAMYSQLWADEGNVHKWRYLIITYKGLDGEGNEVDIVHQRTIDENGTDDYNMSDNWLFRNLIWTEEQIDDYADAMIAKMQDVTWFPFEMWCAGLPYLETGDEIEISLNGESYTSYVLQRQLKGIQNLQDTYINGTLDIF